MAYFGLIAALAHDGLVDNPIGTTSVTYLDSSSGQKWTATQSGGAPDGPGFTLEILAAASRRRRPLAPGLNILEHFESVRRAERPTGQLSFGKSSVPTPAGGGR